MRMGIRRTYSHLKPSGFPRGVKLNVSVFILLSQTLKYHKILLGQTFLSSMPSFIDRGYNDVSVLKLRCTNKYIEFPSENRVLARCMSRLISFAIALSCCAARERSEIFKMKNSCPQWDSIPGSLAR